MVKLLCPVCREALTETEKTYVCKNRHSFDKAKEGYINLLISGKPGELTGDNRDMAVSRREFLSGGYFSALPDALYSEIKKLPDIKTAVDICCGEGYYSSLLSEKTDIDFCGFDISKEMVRLAAKRKSGVTYFVANMSHVPVGDGAFDLGLHLFAPFHDTEFSRIIKKDGYVLSVIPGSDHLLELKSLLYEKPYKNDEAPHESKLLKLTDTVDVKDTRLIESERDLLLLFKMTPYYYRTEKSAAGKLHGKTPLEITTHFKILIYKNEGK